MNFPWLTESQIEAKATELLRKTFGTRLDRRRPINLEDIVCHLSDSEELIFNDDADLHAENGETVLGKTQPLKHRIFLSRELKLDPDTGRARFTLAHEFGHWVLHRPLFVAQTQELSLFGPADDGFEFVGLSRAIFPGAGGAGIPPEEWQASRFAIALLIDGDVLRDEFQRRFGTTSVGRRSPGWRLRSSSLREHSRRLATGAVDGMVPLREVFGLSGEAMAIALEARGYALEDPPLL
jgi:Zn-dependent peptidase ImmA (M78 family)